MNTQTIKKQPVKRYYLIAMILMIVGLVYFPWGYGEDVNSNQLAVSVAFIGIAVACVIRGRRNKREAQS